MKRKNIFHATNPYTLTQELFDKSMACPRCFYLQAKLGVTQNDRVCEPINSSMIELLKKEFAIYRSKQEVPPVVKEHGLKLVPFKHKEVSAWQNEDAGLNVELAGTNLIVQSAVDDIWINPKTKELHPVAFQFIAKKTKLVQLEAAMYKKIALTAWLLKKYGYKVSTNAYVVYAIAKKTSRRLDAPIELVSWLQSYKIENSWVDQALANAYTYLQADQLPAKTLECGSCQYFTLVLNAVTKAATPKN